MTLLLDTHIWLWMLAAPDRLKRLRRPLEDEAATLLLSAASSWEIAIKYGIGRFELPEPPAAYVPSRLRESGVTPIEVEHTHVLAVADLPSYHRDPFDRLLITQARIYDVPLATSDSAFAPYDVRLLHP